MLLRNPRDSRLLYKMNDVGETPYQIDLGNKKSILTQIFGTKSLSDPKQGSNDLSQYDLYSSALADILGQGVNTENFSTHVLNTAAFLSDPFCRKLEYLIDFCERPIQKLESIRVFSKKNFENSFFYCLQIIDINNWKNSNGLQFIKS